MKEVYIKNDNYIQISGWMLNELDLKGNELMIYALIHGFSQDGKSDYHGGLQYIALWTNSTKQGVIKALKSLLEKGFIQKEVCSQNGIQFAKYWTVKSRLNTRQISSGKQSLPPTQSTKFTTTQKESGKQSLPDQSTEFNGGSQLSLPNNININSLNSTSANEKEKLIDKEAEEDFITLELKKIFAGHFVFDEKFTQEIQELANQFELPDSRIPVYLHYVFERASSKKPVSLTNMYYKMAKSANIMQDFILSVQNKEPNENKQTAICPVCGSKANLYQNCPCCDFDMSDKDNEKTVSIKKKIFNLSDIQKQQFEAEYEAELIHQSSYDLLERATNKSLQQEFKERIDSIYRKYGITA